MTELPLGKATSHPDQYAPDTLCRIDRTENRERIGLGGALPFSGVDIWNAWDLTWLDDGGKPQTATAEIRIPADSPGIVESKSMKLYLGSFAMSGYASPDAVRDLIESDVGSCVGAAVSVRIDTLSSTRARGLQRLPGQSLDRTSVECTQWQVSPDLLCTETDEVVSEDLYTDGLRSLCPVTGQPDLGSLLVCYEGPKIDRASLLRYIVSYRRHRDFHENCVERMFVDLLDRCSPHKLIVYARYQRRGGLDINPFRSNFEAPARNLRLWRQ
jgi:7-cyano-7-deazaguanine reductase